MDKDLRKNNEGNLRILFNFNGLLIEVLVDVNEDSNWRQIINYKENIVEIESSEWLWIRADESVVLFKCGY